MLSKEILVKNSGWVELPQISDERDGVLNIMEVGKNIPFDIKRVYYINHLENCVSERGKHAHKALEQVIFCINGSFVLTLDDGEKQQDILMNRSNQGVILGVNLWHTMHDFSSGCVLLVVASDVYRESDYIRDYDEFKQYVENS
ncbi:FdtA/QdtA family cupin domain-containing protein [Lentisphaera profundi]|uniref:FdtA/QdtA family cupin domain-containing protein n=1 Tax=Lentisphaera profundi TaxID=1658616 RepID=A0ABY7VRW5_9BACT|nr:FdtA/QdtA family cupin domain-containing protein [Lentisphaera profundi]WDE95965.1 FdtA/QdtA family cupin domain-containing protein [Lentisphaera profundi]